MFHKEKWCNFFWRSPYFKWRTIVIINPRQSSFFLLKSTIFKYIFYVNSLPSTLSKSKKPISNIMLDCLFNSDSLLQIFIKNWFSCEKALVYWKPASMVPWCYFCEYASRARKDNSTLNLNVLHKTALNLVSQAQYKRISKKQFMFIFMATLKPTLFLDILFDPSSFSPQK